MSHDPFGSLEDWGRVLVTLEKLTEQGRLDHVQPGLIRLLRYRDNWKLREHTLIAVRQVENPSADLVTAVMNVLMDIYTFVDARILAAKALAHLGCRVGLIDEVPGVDTDSVRSVLASQLESPEAPVLTRAIEGAIRKLDESLVAAR